MKREKASIRCGKGWLRISALGNREKNIHLEFIKQVTFEKDEILIEIDGGEWTIVKLYNHQTIEEYVGGKKREYGDYWDWAGKDKKAEYFAEATNLEREWIEALGQDIPLPKGKEIGWWFTPGTEEYYLKDEDFNKLSNRLNQLIDSYMIEEEKTGIEEEKGMKIVLTRDDVFRLICEKYDIDPTDIAGQVVPRDSNIYWEGNPEKKEE